jgi:hypothetical protein
MPAQRPLCHRWVVAATLGALLLSSGRLPAQALEDSSVVRAWFSDPASLRAVSPLLGHAQIDREKGLLRTEADAGLRAALIDAGFRVETDLEATLAIRRLASAERAGMKSIPGFACYRTVEETEATMQSLVASAPGLAEIVEIGPSWQAQNGNGGYQLKVLRATNRAIPGPKPKVFVMASVHAREYTPAEFATRFVEQLIAGHGVDADATWLLDHHELHALLQANPDGRKKAETGLSWRKNVNTGYCGGGNSAGIDINRNFPFEWGNWNGSSGAACDSTYRGPAPASEPETQAVIAYVRSQFEDRREQPLSAPADADTPGVFFDVHSFSGLVLWPWGFSELTAPNATALQAFGRRMAWFNGYTPQAAVGLYPTDGTTDDFAYGDLGVAAYTFELGTAFFQDCASFESRIYPDNRGALLYALRSARAPYRLPAGPDALDLRAEPDLAAIGDSVRLVATFDDQRQREGSFDASGPQPPVQAVASANLFLGLPPWEAGAQAQAMLPADAAFNSSVEAAELSIDTAGLDAGAHLFWVQGRDAAGNDGPPAAAFIDLRDAADLLTVQGTVRQFGSQAPLEASVSAGIYRSETDSVTGGYQRRLPAGSYDIIYSANGHETLTLPAVSGQGGQTLLRNVSLYRLCGLLDDPVEIGASSPFSAAAPWVRRNAAGIDGGAAWLQSTSGNYGNNLNAALTSGLLDLSGYDSPELVFDQRCDTEATYDFGRVEISSNGGSSWNEVFRCDGETSWRQVRLALPQLAGVATARVRFRFTSDSGVTAPGWALDHIVLQAGGQTCRDTQGPVRPEPFHDGFEASLK